MGNVYASQAPEYQRRKTYRYMQKCLFHAKLIHKKGFDNFLRWRYDSKRICKVLNIDNTTLNCISYVIYEKPFNHLNKYDIEKTEITKFKILVPKPLKSIENLHFEVKYDKLDNLVMAKKDFELGIQEINYSLDCFYVVTNLCKEFEPYPIRFFSEDSEVYNFKYWKNSGKPRRLMLDNKFEIYDVQ